MLEYDYRPAMLRCENGDLFTKAILHVRVVSNEGGGPQQWVPETGAAIGVECSECESLSVGLAD